MAIERVDLREDHLTIQIDQQMLLRMCGIAVANDELCSIMLSAPTSRVRRGHQLRLVIPSNAALVRPRNEKLVQFLADAMEARAMTLASPDQSLQQIATAHGRYRKRLTKLIRISWLAPQIMQSILDGTRPSTMTGSQLFDANLPLAWTEQTAALA